MALGEALITDALIVTALPPKPEILSHLYELIEFRFQQLLLHSLSSKASTLKAFGLPDKFPVSNR